MGKIAKILDLPFDQKFLIISMCLSVEHLSQIAVEQSGKTEEVVMEETLEYVKEHLGTEIQEAKINFLLKKFFDSYTLTF